MFEGKTVYMRYAHLNKIYVDPCKNSKVQEGDLIADTGKTGNARTLPDAMAHLHFEIMKMQVPQTGKTGNQNRYNPLDFMQPIRSNKEEQDMLIYFNTYPWVPR
jgi:murein DD-endopeptidase MepM/ murein hydrolase activator NlpD